MTTRSINIKTALNSASYTISEMESLIESCHHQFEFILPSCILRKHQPSPWLREAYARVLCAKNYVAAIDSSDNRVANQHRAERATWVCTALDGAVRALLSRAYVELAQQQPAYKNYKPLGEQALSYSQLTLGGNWEYFVPTLLIWEDCKLPESQERYVLMLLNNGDAALNYALALKSQLKVLERHPYRAKLILSPSLKEVQLVTGENYFFGESTQPEPYELPRVLSWMEDRVRFKTRREVESAWGAYVYDEAREANYYRMGGKWTHDLDYGQPKDRIAGFKRRRGGSGARQRRLSRRQAGANHTA